MCDTIGDNSDGMLGEISEPDPRAQGNRTSGWLHTKATCGKQGACHNFKKSSKMDGVVWASTRPTTDAGLQRRSFAKDEFEISGEI